MVHVSSWNYPGGHALQKLHVIAGSVPPDQNLVYLDDAACISGVSLFGEDPSWRYSKEEHLEDFSRFNFLLSENVTVSGFTQIGSEAGYVGLDLKQLLRGGIWNFVQIQPKIYLHRREYT